MEALKYFAGLSTLEMYLLYGGTLVVIAILFGLVWSIPQKKKVEPVSAPLTTESNDDLSIGVREAIEDGWFEGWIKYKHQTIFLEAFDTQQEAFWYAQQALALVQNYKAGGVKVSISPPEADTPQVREAVIKLNNAINENITFVVTRVTKEMNDIVANSVNKDFTKEQVIELLTNQAKLIKEALITTHDQ